MAKMMAVDVGFGCTKYTTVFDPEQPQFQCRDFPSLCPGWQGDAGSLTLDGRRTRKAVGAVPITVRTPAGATTFAVGPGAFEHASRTYARARDHTYSESPGYLALTLGAMHFANVPDELDLLVVGLPVEPYEGRRRALRERLRGEHVLPSVDGGTRSVRVRDVLVMPQPLGGFVDAVQDEEGIEANIHIVTAIVDIGFVTIDVVIARGMRMLRGRCGSFDNGITSVLEEIANTVRRDHGGQFPDLEPLDQAFRTGRKLVHFGQELDLEPYFAEVVGRKADESINAIVSLVGDGQDVRRLVVVGGGVRLFEKAIRRRFRHDVLVSRDPQFANVRGFATWGALHARREAERQSETEGS